MDSTEKTSKETVVRTTCTCISRGQVPYRDWVDRGTGSIGDSEGNRDLELYSTLQNILHTVNSQNYSSTKTFSFGSTLVFCDDHSSCQLFNNKNITKIYLHTKYVPSLPIY